MADRILRSAKQGHQPADQRAARRVEQGSSEGRDEVLAAEV